MVFRWITWVDVLLLTMMKKKPSGIGILSSKCETSRFYHFFLRQHCVVVQLSKRRAIAQVILILAIFVVHREWVNLVIVSAWHLFL